MTHNWTERNKDERERIQPLRTKPNQGRGFQNLGEGFSKVGIG